MFILWILLGCGIGCFFTKWYDDYHWLMGNYKLAKQLTFSWLQQK